MKLTKKAAALLLAASLAVSVCATPVFAADPEMGSNITTATTPNNTTKVLYKVTSGYHWSVPATINFGEDAGANNTSTVEANLTQNGMNSVKGEPAKKDTDGKWKGTAPKVMVNKNVIEPGKSLKISLKAEDGTNFQVKTGEGTNNTTLDYSVKTKAEKKDKNQTAAYSEINVQPNGSLILELNAGVNTGEVDLEFVLNTTQASAEIAGKYEGNVVFTADATAAPTI